MTLRLLLPSDESLLESFLTFHRDSSMFLRANARRAGLAYQGLPFQALYAGAFREGALVAVAAHCWNGMVLIQAPDQTEEVSTACVNWSGQKVTGLSGPLDQVRRARVALGLEHAAAAIEKDEELYALDLSELVVPAGLATGAIECRAPRPEERETLCDWRHAYDIETLGGEDSDEHRQRAAEYLDAQIAGGNAWVAVDKGVPVSLSAFNASLPDIVQLGGIYTPPALRGRGYAKVAVTASLVSARERGASRAVLFTTNPSAVRCYQAVGFRRAGEYGLILLR